MVSIEQVNERAKEIFEDCYKTLVNEDNYIDFYKDSYKEAIYEFMAKEMTVDELLDNLFCMGYYGHGDETDEEIDTKWSKEEIEEYYVEKRLEMDAEDYEGF